MTAMTRGPLPARVYWVRRVVVVVLVAAVVLGIVQLVSLLAGAGSSQEPDQAAPAAAEVSTTPTAEPTVVTTEPAAPQREGRKNSTEKKGKRDRGPVLAEPEGPCTDRDIAVTPSVEDAVGGRPVVFTLGLRTIASPACEWEVSPQTLSVKVTSGEDDIWFSSQCPRAIPRENVVLRNNVTTEVEVTWSSRRSDEGCTRYAEWALPGWYHVEAAALAGEPSDLQFRLTAPEPEVVTETVEPDPKPGQGRDRGDQRPDRDRG